MFKIATVRVWGELTVHRMHDEMKIKENERERVRERERENKTKRVR